LIPQIPPRKYVTGLSLATVQPTAINSADILIV